MFDTEEIKSAVVAVIAEKIAGGFSGPAHERSFVDGERVLIRTVTSIALGEVMRENQHFVWLKDACWVPDTGRYSKALAEGCDVLDEVEMVKGPRRIAIGAIVDVDVWAHDLPTETK